MLGSLMFLTKFLMQNIPNIHLLGLFIAVAAVLYRTKALIPLYIYVTLDGIVHGFALWWVPYLYIWLPLWGMILLAEKLKIPTKIKPAVYMCICGIHGLSFGLLYAPFQALVYGLSLNQTIAWVIAGLPFDITHAISNFIAASLTLPICRTVSNVTKNN